MKFSNYLVVFGLMLLGSVSLNANAQTPVCTWSSVMDIAVAVVLTPPLSAKPVAMLSPHRAQIPGLRV